MHQALSVENHKNVIKYNIKKNQKNFLLSLILDIFKCFSARANKYLVVT